MELTLIAVARRRRAGDVPLAVRAAGAAGGAGRVGERRPAPAARRRDRPRRRVRDLHAAPRRACCAPSGCPGPAAKPCHRDAGGGRHRAAGSGGGEAAGPPRTTPLAAAAGAPSRRRRRVLVGRRAGRRAVAGVDAVRRADPGRGHGAQRRAAASRSSSWRSRSPTRSAPRCRCSCSRCSATARRHPWPSVRRGGPMLRRVAGAVLLATAVLFTTDIPTQLAAGAPVVRLRAAEAGALGTPSATTCATLDPSTHSAASALAAGDSAGHAQELRPGTRTSPTSPAGSNTPGGTPLSSAEPARQGRAGGLLDVLLRQLHPHAAVPEGLGRPLPPRRAS